ncbi:hypothetical protein ACE38W_00820 [Chitinophaga sp. Hz27]|uniref:hypothetical protein n=1 Tax=Chitinophaga sp. Hz27 TaxID=3347169 RepID=UPI0035D70461
MLISNLDFRGTLPQDVFASTAEDPYKAVAIFCDMYPLPRARGILNGWFRSFVSTKPFKDPNDLLWFYERLLNIMDAAYYLKEKDNSECPSVLLIEKGEEAINLMDATLFFGGYDSYDAWDYFPRNLSKKEFKNPYKVFGRIFRTHTLFEWRNMLHILLHAGLTPYTSLKGGDIEDVNILQAKIALDKLVEAVGLIDIRKTPPKNLQRVENTMEAQEPEDKNQSA